MRGRFNGIENWITLAEVLLFKPLLLSHQWKPPPSRLLAAENRPLRGYGRGTLKQ